MKFLVFQHVPHEHPGLIAKFAKEHFIQLDIVELWKPYAIPNSITYQALIVMGGPMGVYEGKDLYPSKDDEVKFIKENIEKLPMLGLCLGAQILAFSLGANVYPNNQEGKMVKEIGYYDTNLTSAGESSEIFKGFSSQFPALQWHGDTFDIPTNAEHLASTTKCKNQAFSYKNIFGLQFHFEFTPEMVTKQIEIDKEYIHDNFTIDEAFLQEQSKEYATRMEDQNNTLLTNFLRIIGA